MLFIIKIYFSKTTVSVVGPSGSGKSTLLNMIGALDRPTSGKVFLDGLDIFSLKDSQIAAVRNGTLGFIFQSYNLINRTTILKNVEFPGITGGMTDGDRKRLRKATTRIPDKSQLSVIGTRSGKGVPGLPTNNAH
ncbi:MAG: ATP-binding cassette domain-containing protein [Candidatus Nitrosopolaris sp.]